MFWTLRIFYESNAQKPWLSLSKYDLPLILLEELQRINEDTSIFIYTRFGGTNPIQLSRLTIIVTKLIVIFEIITSLSEVKKRQ